MKKWITLAVITGILLLVDHFFAAELGLHTSFVLMVLFFAVQTIVLFRIDMWVPEEWKAQATLVKVVIRLLSSLVFILVLTYTEENLYTLAIQFIIIYLVYMIFEIGEALTNLRRN